MAATNTSGKPILPIVQAVLVFFWSTTTHFNSEGDVLVARKFCSFQQPSGSGQLALCELRERENAVVPLLANKLAG